MRLVAILRYSITLQVEIRKKKRGLAVMFGDGLPQPLRGLSAVARLAGGSIQITLRHSEFLAAISRQRFRLRVLPED